MSVTETRRIELLEAARQTMGRDVAITVTEMLPPSGWGDVATRQRVDALERDIHVRFDALETKYDARFDAIDARFKAVGARFDAIETTIDTRFDAIDMRFDSFAAEMRSELRAGIAEIQANTMRWAVGTIVAMAGVGAAVAGMILPVRLTDQTPPKTDVRSRSVTAKGHEPGWRPAKSGSPLV